MNTTQAILREEDYCEKRVLYMALELSHKTWRLVFSGGGKEASGEYRGAEPGAARRGDREGEGEVWAARGGGVKSCYEAGRDSFWLHRHRLSVGIENVVLESASIEVDRRARRAKTDRLDGGKLLKQLVRHHRDGEYLRVVRVPSVEHEDERGLHRELERLVRACARGACGIGCTAEPARIEGGQAMFRRQTSSPGQGLRSVFA